MLKQVFHHSRTRQTLIFLLSATAFCLSLRVWSEGQEAAPRALQSKPDEVGDFALLDQEGKIPSVAASIGFARDCAGDHRKRLPDCARERAKTESAAEKVFRQESCLLDAGRHPQDDRASVVVEPTSSMSISRFCWMRRNWWRAASE